MIWGEVCALALGAPARERFSPAGGGGGGRSGWSKQCGYCLFLLALRGMVAAMLGQAHRPGSIVGWFSRVELSEEWPVIGQMSGYTIRWSSL